MFTEEVAREIGAVAKELDIEPAALLAVAEIESGGKVFAVVDGRSEPLIRFEGHYFDRRLSDANRARARAAGLSSPEAGAVANPASQADRWGLLGRCAAIDRKAAYESVSWGLGQVMGAHWAWLGYGSVDDLVAEARSGAAGQARLMGRYIEKAGLGAALRDRDWEAFAHGYNGPGFRRYAYHVKIAAAYARLTGTKPASYKDPTPDLLGRGSSGDGVRDLQQCLTALGYPLDIDGRFGPGTEKAVMAFQRDHGLPADGIAGPKTRAAISSAIPFGHSARRLWTRLLGWLAGFFGRG